MDLALCSGQKPGFKPLGFADLHPAIGNNAFNAESTVGSEIIRRNELDALVFGFPNNGFTQRVFRSLFHGGCQMQQVFIRSDGFGKPVSASATAGLPSVMVPVLSNTKVSSSVAFSRASARLNRIPFSAPLPVPGP